MRCTIYSPVVEHQAVEHSRAHAAGSGSIQVDPVGCQDGLTFGPQVVGGTLQRSVFIGSAHQRQSARGGVDNGFRRRGGGARRHGCVCAPESRAQSSLSV